MELIKPTAEHLPSYFAALWRGWSPDTTRNGIDQGEITRVTEDPERFLALLPRVIADARSDAGFTTVARQTWGPVTH